MKKNPNMFLISAALLSLIILSILAKIYPYFPIDLRITLFLQQFKFTPFHDLMFLVSAYGYGVSKFIVLGIAVIVLLIKGFKKEAILLAFSTIGAELLSGLLKTVVSRHRPDPKLITQVVHFDKPDSFPSGHVLFYVGFFGFLLFLSYRIIPDKKIRTVILAVCTFSIITVGPSRIYLGAHWLSDVVGAYLAGFIWVTISVLIYNRWKLKNEK